MGQEILRTNRIAIEDRTRPHERPTGTYQITGENPLGVELTRPDSTHHEAVVRARSLTRRHKDVTLTGPLEVYNSPALD